jgi:hypothetical protein
MNRVAPLLTISIALLLAGCDKQDPESPLCDAGNYFPLKTGNWWVYESFRRNVDGSVEQRENDSLFISRDTLMLGRHFYRLEGQFFSRPFGHWLAYDNGKIVASDGCIYFRCPQLFGSDRLYPVFHFDFPAVLQTTRKDTLLELPAGDFKPVMLMEARCIVEDTIWTNTYRFYYSRKVGLIRWEAQATGFDFSTITNLIRYHIN